MSCDPNLSIRGSEHQARNQTSTSNVASNMMTGPMADETDRYYNTDSGAAPVEEEQYVPGNFESNTSSPAQSPIRSPPPPPAFNNPNTNTLTMAESLSPIGIANVRVPITVATREE